MSIRKSYSTGDTLTTSTSQPATAQPTGHSGPSISFFAVGMLINVVLLTAYLVWAYRQWGKSGKRDKRS